MGKTRLLVWLSTASIALAGTLTILRAASASVRTDVLPGADLFVQQTGPATVASGDSFPYHFSVSNRGPESAPDVEMNDPLPAGLVFLSCLTGQGTCVGPPPGEGGTVTARLGRLDVNAIATIEIVVRVVAPGGSRLTNAATFTAPVADPTPISTSMVSTSVTGSTDLSATMTGPPAAALADRVTYTVTVANAGPDDAPYVVLENSVPDGAAFVSCQTSQGFCGFSPPTSVALGAIGAGGSATVTYVFEVRAVGGHISNRAVVALDEYLQNLHDHVPANNAAGVTTNVTSPGTADLRVSIQGRQTCQAGQSEALTCVTVTNRGPARAVGVVVSWTDQIEGEAADIEILDSGESRGFVTTFTCSGPTSAHATSLTPDAVPGNETAYFYPQIVNCDDVLRQNCPIAAILAKEICEARMSDPGFTACPSVSGPSTPGRSALGALPGFSIDLRVFHRVRDEVFAASPAGRRYTRLYYEHGPEIAGLLLTSPTLFAQGLSVLTLWQESLRSLADGRGATAVLSFEQIDALYRLLDQLNRKGSPALAAVIAREEEALKLYNLVGRTVDQALYAQSLTGDRTITIPAVASVHGLAGAFFHSDLDVVNPSSTRAATIRLRYRCSTGTCPDTAKTLVIEPREQRHLDDVVATLFGAAESAGALEITGDEVLVESRVYSPARPDPTAGTGVPGLGADEAFAESVLMSLSRSSGLRGSFRSNAGVYNPSDVPLVATFTVFDAGGTKLGETTRPVGARAAVQVNDLLGAAGIAGDVANAYAVVTADGVHELFAYATVLDNGTQDPVFVRGRNNRGGPSGTVTLPAAASIHGLNGAFFHSDVRVFNPSPTQSATVMAEYRCFTGACDRVARTFTVAPREMKVFDDVVAALFAAPESAGSIEFTGDLVFVESRVYTPERTLPTTGSHVPGLLPDQARLESVLTSLAHSALLSAGFRTNVGFYNPGPAEESALVTLHLPDGAEVGRLTVKVGRRSAAQVNDVFSAAGVPFDVPSAYAIVKSEHGGPLFSYATVLDNRSQDPVLVTGKALTSAGP